MSAKIPSQRIALASAVAAGTTIKDAAASLGINYKTALRWSADPSFKHLLHQLQSQAVADAMSILTMGMAKSAQTLIELLNDPAPKMRLAAAVALLDKAAKYRELVDLQQRIDEIEARMEQETQP